MNEDAKFVQALSQFLALHTEQSTSYLSSLIEAFLRGGQARPTLDRSAKEKLIGRLKADMEEHQEVPSFLQNYLLTHMADGGWPPQAVFIASRYLSRQPEERFTTWQRRQAFISELAGEPIRGTELGIRQMLYSQGAGPLFRWRGVPCFKSTYDIGIYAMLIDELQPGTIIELGSGAGGSSLLFSDLCTSMGHTTDIISIDKAIAEVSDPRIVFVQADCLEWLAAQVKSKTSFRRPILIIEDFHVDLASFFPHIDEMLEEGDYLVIEDSFPKQGRISEVIRDRPYAIDTKYTDFFGVNCTSAVNSIFMKNTNADAQPSRTQQDRELLRDQDRAWRQRLKSGR
jgi:cephalosporin hydroxylase